MRIHEELKVVVGVVPAALAAATDATTAFIDAAGAQEVQFVITAAALAQGKSLTVTVLESDVAAGTDATAVGEAVVLTAAKAMATGAVASVSVDCGGRKRYLAVKFQHNGTEATVCGANAMVKGMYRPAENAMAASL